MSDGTTTQSNPAETLQALHMMSFARRMENDQRNLNHAQAMGEAQIKRQWGDAFEPSEPEEMDFRYNSPTTVHYHETQKTNSATSAPMPEQPPPTPPVAPPPEPEKSGILDAVPGVLKTAALLSTAGATGAGLILAAQMIGKPSVAAPPPPNSPSAIIESKPATDTDTQYRLTLPRGKKPDEPNSN